MSAMKKIWAFLGHIRKHVFLIVTIFALAVFAYFLLQQLSLGKPILDDTKFVIMAGIAIAVSLLLVLSTYEGHLKVTALQRNYNSKSFAQHMMKQFQFILDARTGINHYYTKKFSGQECSVNLDDMTQDYVAVVISRAKSIFDELTGDECAVCVKRLGLNEDGAFPELPTVVKTIRDPASQLRRSVDNNEKIDIRENTAFDFIMDRKNKKDFYFNNALFRSYLEGVYQNSRNTWQNHYNATAVCAIRNPSKDYDNEVLGFLCIDNTKGGFDAELTYAIMQSVSSCLFYVYKNLDIIKRAELKNQHTKHGDL
jgi:hypothetical protein